MPCVTVARALDGSLALCVRHTRGDTGGVITLEEVLAGAGPGLLSVASAGPAPAVVTDLVVADVALDDVGGPGDLVLGIGLLGADAAGDLVDRAAERGAAAVVLPEAQAEDTRTRERARTHGLWLLAMPRAVSWVQLVWTLRAVVEWPGSGEGGADGGVATDLFAVADAVAAIIDAPVTIEDSQSRVLAYSRGQDSGDPARHSTIVGRRVPAPVLAHFRAQGVFRRLTTSGEPFFVAAEHDVRARFVFPVRAGEEWLGSIWAVVDRPVPVDRVAEVRRITAALAVHLLRLRAQADLARRSAEAELGRWLQEGRATTTLAPGPVLGAGPWRVVVLADLYGDDADPRRDVELWRSTLRRHGWSEPRLCLVQGRVHAVVAEDRAGAGTWAWLEGLVGELHGVDPTYRAAAGEPVGTPEDLPRSQTQAMQAYAVLGADAVTTHEHTWARRILERATAAVAEAGASGPLAPVVEHDTAHRTAYVATLVAHLRWPGQPRRAAAELGVHPNTLRQRMARIEELVAVDLSDPDARLALQLQASALARRPT